MTELDWVRSGLSKTTRTAAPAAIQKLNKCREATIKVVKKIEEIAFQNSPGAEESAAATGIEGAAPATTQAVDAFAAATSCGRRIELICPQARPPRAFLRADTARNQLENVTGCPWWHLRAGVLEKNAFSH